MIYADATQPPDLKKVTAQLDIRISQQLSYQLILVLAQGSLLYMYCYEKSASGIWHLAGPAGTITGHGGRNGITDQKQEGDSCTPAGLFSLGFAFGNNGKPQTKMPFRKITTDSYWVDDPNSHYYNLWVEGRECADWASAEHLADYPREYAYAVVIEYNTRERLPGKGSAVFLHCGDQPTSGCISVSEKDMLRLLQWLDPEKSPCILITN